jgi:hypothetical protein
MSKRLIGWLSLAVGITTIFALLQVSLPLKTIIGMCLAQFLGMLITYPWIWKPRKFTFGRLTLMALVVSSISAAILVISSGFADR